MDDAKVLMMHVINNSSDDGRNPPKLEIEQNIEPILRDSRGGMGKKKRHYDEPKQKIPYRNQYFLSSEIKIEKSSKLGSEFGFCSGWFFSIWFCGPIPLLPGRGESCRRRGGRGDRVLRAGPRGSLVHKDRRLATLSCGRFSNFVKIKS